MIIGIFGPSSTGKTTLSKLIAERLGWPLRSCGEMVKARCRILRVPIDALPADEHCAIDQDTINWVRNLQTQGIVEGRFLDQVLVPVVGLVTLVELHASRTVRLERWQLRIDGKFDFEILDRMDAADGQFRGAMYDGAAPITERQCFDTSRSSPEECAEWLNSWIMASRLAPD